MSYAGEEESRCRVWHPLNHISYDVVDPPGAGTVAVGTRLHIREALQRDIRNLLDIRVTVQELAGEHAIIQRTVLGTSVVELTNEFVKTLGGVDYVTTMRIGDRTPLARMLLNRIARTRPFPEQRVHLWVRHHIEEIGNFENFLPALIRERGHIEE